MFLHIMVEHNPSNIIKKKLDTFLMYIYDVLEYIYIKNILVIMY